jgi:valine--pyruvate aminotransferase
MQFSDFGNKFRGGTGIAELMADLADVPQNTPDLCRLGGGNPASIPAAQAAFSQCLQQYATHPATIDNDLGRYPSSQGHLPFIRSLAALLNKQYDWQITERNIVLTNGSQNAFFMLFNLLAGKSGTQHRHILLPMSPEYIGYEDVSINPQQSESLFVSQRPIIEELDDQLFKYRLDTEQLRISNNTAAVCVSRPTNPTGNVITDNELMHIDKLASEHQVPLIIDNAYGAPFPNIIHVDNTLFWHENIVLSMSLSKLGLPGARTGIIVANEELISALTQMNAVMNLSPAALAPSIVQRLFDDESILTICENHIRPFYEERSAEALALFSHLFSGLPAKAHKPEGSIFLWLWFPTLTVSSKELYQRLKKRGVIIVPGHYFFPGLNDDWQHKQQCIRVNIGGDFNEIRQGLTLIADELTKAI